MMNILLDNELSVTVRNYDLYKTINSGQMFRWIPEASNGWYLGFSRDRVCRAKQVGDVVTLQLPADSDFEYWENLLCLSDEEEDIAGIMESNAFLSRAYACSKGLRILKQDAWETLVSFIVSQRNNIPRIKSCIEKVCWAKGKSLGSELYTFPNPEDLLPGSLANCGLGYRENYIYGAASMVLDGQLDFQGITYPSCNLQRALQELCRVTGVGIKVASCVALFGLRHGDAFPIDVWIERALAESGLTFDDVATWGEHKGIIQQHMYYYMLFRGD